mmetsp:Transcript_81273/g.234948  ORF Transcript_81273/g.234948 Transcript_81273/m.234948 type:complete len:465 (-) Transcript_81273:441-1835(-)
MVVLGLFALHRGRQLHVIGGADHRQVVQLVLADPIVARAAGELDQSVALGVDLLDNALPPDLKHLGRLRVRRDLVDDLHDDSLGFHPRLQLRHLLLDAEPAAFLGVDHDRAVPLADLRHLHFHPLLEAGRLVIQCLVQAVERLTLAADTALLHFPVDPHAGLDVNLNRAVLPPFGDHARQPTLVGGGVVPDLRPRLEHGFLIDFAIGGLHFIDDQQVHEVRGEDPLPAANLLELDQSVAIVIDPPDAALQASLQLYALRGVRHERRSNDHLFPCLHLLRGRRVVARNVAVALVRLDVPQDDEFVLVDRVHPLCAAVFPEVDERVSFTVNLHDEPLSEGFDHAGFPIVRHEVLLRHDAAALHQPRAALRHVDGLRIGTFLGLLAHRRSLALPQLSSWSGCYACPSAHHNELVKVVAEHPLLVPVAEINQHVALRVDFRHVPHRVPLQARRLGGIRHELRCHHDLV